MPQQHASSISAAAAVVRENTEDKQEWSCAIVVFMCKCITSEEEGGEEVCGHGIPKNFSYIYLDDKVLIKCL